MKDKSYFKTFSIGIVALWLIIFALIPNLMVLIVSFLERNQSHIINFNFELDNYIRLFDTFFVKVFFKSFYLSSITTIICLLIAFPFASLITKFPKNIKKILLLLVIIPFWTSSLIRTYAIVVILKTNGILNKLLLWAGIINEPFRILYTDTAVFIALVYALLPFMILPLYATLEKFDNRLIEAAKDLGANKIRVFFKIILPMTLPGIIAGCMLVFLPAMGLFYIPDLLGGAKSLLVGNLIKNQFLSVMDWPFGSAASVILTIIMGLIIAIYMKVLKRFNKTMME
jgi:spermidine/putrescine transport system permease protein